MKLTYIILIVLSISSSYQYGRYKGHKFDELKECHEKLRQQILTGNSAYITQLRKAPFDVVYYYTAGKIYDCAFRRNGNL